jgi:hypothetical protein
METEYALAQNSTKNAHFTGDAVVDPIWATLVRMGDRPGTQGWASHTASMLQNIFDWKCFLELFQAVRDLGRQNVPGRTECPFPALTRSI